MAPPTLRPTATSPLVSPIIPSSTAHLASRRADQRDGDQTRRNARRRLPLPTIRAPRAAHIVYGMAAVESSGRIVDQSLLAALGWPPGLRIDIRPADHGVAPVGTTGAVPGRDQTSARASAAQSATGLSTGLVVVCPDPRGAFRLTTAGRLLLPADLRRASGLRTGDRVLLAADRVHGRLIVCPPIALDTLLAQLLRSPLDSAVHQQGGDAA